MQQDFAVLLMRSSYAVADELDYYPMDEFQKDFFLLRQREWEVYREQMPTTLQGDLADPNYFDFISFCQYATIDASMKQGRQVFEELIDANGTTTVVARDPSLRDNALLPDVFLQRVGDRILNYLVDTYPTGGPRLPSVPTAASVLQGVQAIVNLFEVNDYHLLARLSPATDGFELTIVAPATFWGQEVNDWQDTLRNDFEAITIQAYLRRSGVPATYTTRIAGTEVTHKWRWPSGLLA